MRGWIQRQPWKAVRVHREIPVRFQVDLRIHRPDEAGGCKVSCTIRQLTPEPSSRVLSWNKLRFPDPETAEREAREYLRAYVRDRYAVGPEAYEVEVIRAEEP